MTEITLTQQQQAAYDLLLDFAGGKSDYGMALLEGYAGTGKTTLVGSLIRALSGRMRIAIAAPTNKAVRVLKEKIEEIGQVEAAPAREWDAQRRCYRKHQIEFGSIHSFLGLRLKERDDGTQECRRESDPTIHEYGLVVIDECSMLDRDLLQQIAVAKRQARVLFVGDPAQLPPVGDGGGQVSPVFEQVTLRATLSEVVRQAADNPIIRLSIAIRQHMEHGAAISALSIAEHLPPLPAKAGLVTGGPDVAAAIALDAIADGEDARIIAYTNQQVLAYNQALHETLHGTTYLPFVAGERVILHEQHEARCKINDFISEPVTLITSEECEVLDAEERHHPLYAMIPSGCIELLRDNGQRVTVYVALAHDELMVEINRLFGEWRQKRAEAELMRRAGRRADAEQLDTEAKKASSRAWGLKKAFAPLRHAYAVTAHKSQGSTYDTAVVDLGNLSKMRSAFDFNRALYVAATRAREHLAIVV